MGCGASTPESEEARAQAAVSKQIEKELAKEKKDANTLIKAILLGSGSSGKSTICKQMRLLFLDGYNKKDSMAFREPIVLNVLRNMQQLLEAAERWGYAYAPALQSDVAKMLAMQVGGGEELDAETAAMLERLWKDEATRKVVESRLNETNVEDSHVYFMEQLSRLAQPDYIPSIDDILRCRVKTLGIHELHFHSPNALDFTLVDVGGQRTERRKWIHCFEEVTLVLFVVALSEYDQVCEEDAKTNRLVESLTLFKEIANNRFFSRKNICIFYNKDDLFRAKVPRHSFSSFQPEYKGDDSLDSVRAYIEERFESLNTADPKHRVVYSHTTCATDTEQIKVVWMSVADVLLRENLADAGFAQEL